MYVLFDPFLNDLLFCVLCRPAFRPVDVTCLTGWQGHESALPFGYGATIGGCEMQDYSSPRWALLV